MSNQDQTIVTFEKKRHIFDCKDLPQILEIGALFHQ